MTDLVGTSLGAYTIVEHIGRGGMADVYKAIHNSLAIHRALKVILPELVVSSDFRTRFQKEAQAVAALRHPNIVQMHDFGTHNSIYFMVMEFIEGRNLKRMLSAAGRIRPIQHAIDLVLQIADALEYAHARGVIHRDIKPENVMITGTGQPILMDFGIAKLITSETKLTQTGAAMGTPAYMAPEQALGAADISPATDIYALSIVLYELLTGRVPFTADTPVGVVIKTLNDPLPMPQLICPDIGDELQGVIVKGAAKNAAERYNSIADFRIALKAAVARDTSNTAASERETLVIPRAVERTQERTLRRPERRSTTMAVAAAAMFLAAGVSFWIATRKESPEPQASASTVKPAAAAAAPAVIDKVADSDAVATNSTPMATSSLPMPQTTSPPENPTPRSSNVTAEATATPAAAVKPSASIAQEIAAPTTATNSTPTSNTSPPPHTTSEPAPVEPNPRLASASSPTVQTQTAPSATATGSGSSTEVLKGVTTQGDLLRLFGGPNLTTYDENGLETWVYERTVTQTDTNTSSQSRQGSVSLGLFFKSLDAGASVAKESSSATVTTRSAVRSLTVIVKFSPDRTVQDYTVRETYF